MSLARINVKFTADLKQFSTEMQNAVREVQKQGKKLQDVGKILSVGITAPFTALSGISLVNFDAQAQAIAQVETGLLSTGNAAGKTSEELQKLASSLQNNSLFGDEAILKDVTAQLLTFTQITGQEFDRAQQAVLDLATRLDGDLKGAAIQVGKALNDPIKGVSALSKAGIQFTKEQKSTIQSLVDTGKVADAQRIILKELETQFGGSAAAAAKAGTGGWKQLQNQLGDITEEFGALISEAIEPARKALVELATWFQGLSTETKSVILGVSAVAAAIGPLLLSIGTLMRAFPILIANIKLAGTAFQSLSVAFASNPFGIAVASFAALFLIIQSFNTSTEKAVKNILETGNAFLKQRESIQKNNESLTRLVNRYEELKSKSNLSKEEQRELNEVIKQLNTTVPEAATNFDNYGNALDTNVEKVRATVKAQEELARVVTANKIKETELALLKLNSQLQEFENLGKAGNKTYVEGVGVIQKNGDAYERLKTVIGQNGKAIQTKSPLDAKDLELLQQKTAALFEQRDALNELLQSLREQAGLTQNNVQAETQKQRERTVAVIEEEIKAQRDLLQEQSDRSGAKAIQERIKLLENEKNAILGVTNETLKQREKIKPITLESGNQESQNTIGSIQRQIDKLKEFQREISTTSETWKLAQSEIEKLELQIKIKEEGIESLIRTGDELKNVVTRAEVTAQAVEQMNQRISESFSQVISNAAAEFVSGMATLIGELASGAASLGAVGKFILQSIADLIIQLGKSAIQIGTAMLAVKAAFKNPFGAIAAGAALVVFGTLLKSTLPKDFQRFQDGGIVGGSSTFGDKILARVNSGELILNQKQQRRLWSMLENTGVPVLVDINMKEVGLKGDTIQLALDRSNTKRNRRG